MTVEIVKARYWYSRKDCKANLSMLVQGTEVDTKALFELVSRLENPELLEEELKRLRRGR